MFSAKMIAKTVMLLIVVIFSLVNSSSSNAFPESNSVSPRSVFYRLLFNQYGPLAMKDPFS